MEDIISNLQSDLHRLNAKLIQLAWKIDDVDKKTPEPSLDFQDEIINLNSRLANIEERLDSLSNRDNEIDVGFSELPNTKLLSHNIWTRMWAVWGHSVLGYVMFAIIFYVLFFILELG
jgi:hypothetical protein